jgi:hypothetical protein
MTGPSKPLRVVVGFPMPRWNTQSVKREFYLLHASRSRICNSSKRCSCNEHLQLMAQSAEHFDMVFDDRMKGALENAAQIHGDRGPTRVRLLLGQNGTVTWTASPS